MLNIFFKKIIYYKLVLSFLLIIILLISGCIQNIVSEGKNYDFDPNNVVGYPKTYESRGLVEPEIVEISPKNKYIGPPCSITVTFNTLMNRESVEANFKIYDENNYPYNGKFIWSTILNSDKSYFEYIPVKELPSGTYKVILFKGAKTIANYEMKTNFTSTFTFKPIPKNDN